MKAPARFLLLLLSFALALLLSASLLAAPPELLPPGFRPVPPGVHALTGGRVVFKPGRVLDPATIIIRDGLIETVGTKTPIPAEARVWDMKGLTIYAGFIDPYLTAATKAPASARPAVEAGADLTAGTVRFFGVTAQEREAGTDGPGYEVARITPERRAARNYTPDAKTIEKMRELGFTVANITPDHGILRGTSTLVALSDDDANRAIIKPDVFQHLALDPSGGGGGGGRQAAYPASLMGVIAVTRQSLFDAEHYARDQADYEKHPQNRTRPEYNPGLEALAPVLAKKMRLVIEPRSALMVDRAARLAREQKIDFLIFSSGQEWRRPDLAKAAAVPFIVPLNFPILPKLPSEDDWEQVTLDELRAWDWAPENPVLLRRQGLEIALTTAGLPDKANFRKNLGLALDRGLSETDALAALTTVPARLCGMEQQLGTIEPGKLADLTVVDGKGYFDSEAKVRSVWIDGRFYRIPSGEPKEKADAAARDSAKAESPDEAGKPKPEKKEEASAEEKKQADKEKRTAKLKEAQKRVAHSPQAGRGPLASPSILLIHNATVWTCGPAGQLEDADVLVQGGKILKVGRNLFRDNRLPANAMVIDATGLQVTPGIIDCHSHSAILGGVNEATLPSSAMVRIGDVVNSETPNLYEQLAGGVTVANLLHGSANPIGGQNCVIKLRDGETPEGLKFKGAPEGIKFALGENVKQSNWGDRVNTRFPQTRMGVRTFFANRFVAARQYLKSWADYRKSGGVAPRRDLELEALGEILQGSRLIHCHAYRQDEILMLIRLMDQFDVKIATFQHVLEGYKIADEMARHGAGGSTFSDWWAYKFEVYDAIPYNGALMRERGVTVSFNSDSDDFARRLYLEAAKAVKYGGVPEEEALKFVTLNPARQLHVDAHVGSLEPGKDADIAIWSKSPLDSGTVCRQTWIDGRQYFDIAQAPARAGALADERVALIAKAKKVAALTGGGGGGGDSAANGFFEVSLEHEHDGQDRHCLDDE